MTMRFSVIIPVYFSHKTIEKCIQGLKNQIYTDFEVIFVDSTPDRGSAEIISQHREMTLIRSHERLWMHAARNLGARKAQGEILVFTDPDCVAEPDWLLKLDQAFRKGYEVVGGPIACYPGGYIARVAHLVKFWFWLPNGNSGFYDDIPTANIAFTRPTFDSVQGFPEDFICGDSHMCYRLRAKGVDLYFDVEAKVSHIHNVTLLVLLKERFVRGKEFGKMRCSLRGWSRSKSFLILACLWMIPWLLSFRKIKVCIKRRFLRDCFLSVPLLLCADFAWSLGEGLVYWQHLVHRYDKRVD